LWQHAWPQHDWPLQHTLPVNAMAGAKANATNATRLSTLIVIFFMRALLSSILEMT
jgi:hypothetical protein